MSVAWIYVLRYGSARPLSLFSSLPSTLRCSDVFDPQEKDAKFSPSFFSQTCFSEMTFFYSMSAFDITDSHFPNLKKMAPASV